MSASPPRRPMPAMHEVKSGNLAAVGHDPATNEIHVRFKSGSTVWIYGDCSPELFDKLRQAESPGSFFHRNIKQVKQGRKADA